MIIISCCQLAGILWVSRVNKLIKLHQAGMISHSDIFRFVKKEDEVEQPTHYQCLEGLWEECVSH